MMAALFLQCWNLVCAKSSCCAKNASLFCDKYLGLQNNFTFGFAKLLFIFAMSERLGSRDKLDQSESVFLREVICQSLTTLAGIHRILGIAQMEMEMGY